MAKWKRLSGYNGKAEYYHRCYLKRQEKLKQKEEPTCQCYICKMRNERV